MPYKSGTLKGQLTTAEIRKLVRAHNKLSKITIPPKSSRDQILEIISKAGFRVNHEKQLLEQLKKMDISVEKAKVVTKPVKKTEEQKQQAKEKKEAKVKEQKQKESELIKKGAVIGKLVAKKQMAKEKKGYKDKSLSISKDKKEMVLKISQQEIQEKVDKLEKEKEKFQDMIKEAKTLKEKIEIRKKAMPIVKEITRLKNIIVNIQLKEKKEKESKKPESPPKKESLVFEVGKEYMTIEDKFKDEDSNDEKIEKKIKIIKRTKKFITFDYFEDGKLLSENERRSIKRINETSPEFLPAPFSISARNVV